MQNDKNVIQAHTLSSLYHCLIKLDFSLVIEEYYVMYLMQCTGKKNIHTYISPTPDFAPLGSQKDIFEIQLDIRTNVWHLDSAMVKQN